MSSRPPQGQSGPLPPPPPTPPPPGEHRSGAGTSRSTGTHSVMVSRRCCAQRTIAVTLLCGPTAGYFLFGVCDSALAAAVFADLLDFGLASTLLAALAAFLPVCFVFRLATGNTPLPGDWRGATQRGRLRVSPAQVRPAEGRLSDCAPCPSTRGVRRLRAAPSCRWLATDGRTDGFGQAVDYMWTNYIRVTTRCSGSTLARGSTYIKRRRTLPGDKPVENLWTAHRFGWITWVLRWG